MDPDLEGCDVCGNNHATEDCPILAMDELGGQDQVVSRARMTAPSSVMVHDQADGTVQVVTRHRFEPKQRLGPFEAKRTMQKIDVENGFILKVFGKDNSTVWLDTSDENNCNWLSLVRTADTTKVQNLMAVQLGTDIFYIVTKVVEPGTEFRVWYAPHYARKVGKQTEPDGKTKALLGQILMSLDNTVIAIGSDITPTKLQSIWRQSIGDKDAESLGLSWQTIQGLLSQADGGQAAVGEADPSEANTWPTVNKPVLPRIAYVKHKPNEAGVRSCRHCDAQFDTLEKLAKHVKEHLKASVQDSRAKVKEEPPTPKRKRGRPRKNKIPEETKDKGFTVKAPYVAACTEESQNAKVDTVVPEESTIKLLDVTQDTPDLTNAIDCDMTPEVLNISGEGYRIVVKGTDASGNNITEVHLEGMESAAVTKEQENIGHGADIISEQLPREGLIPEKENIMMSDVGLSTSPEVTEMDVTSDDTLNSPKRRRVGRPGRPSRRGQRGELAKHYTMVMDDTKRFIYKCNHCSLSFVKLELFGRHMTNDHEASRCVTCEVVFPSPHDLQNHICSVTESIETDELESRKTELPILLDAENATTSEGEETEIPLVENEEEGQTYKCHKCDKYFEKVKYLKRHLRGHSDLFLCRDCGKRFVRKETLQKHTCSNEHGLNDDEKSLYHCEFCGVSFAKQNYLLRHMATHTGEFRCKHCNRMFSRKESMLQHIKKYHPESINSTEEKVYPCTQCHRVFSREVTLQNHLKLHEGAHKCEHCGRCFASVFNLEKHTCGIIVTHKNGYQCQQCKKVFHTVSSAQQHLSVHAGELTCSICKSMFSHKNALSQHMVVCSAALESGDSGSFLCTVCDASFPDAGSFRTHYKQHSHPYKCDKCEKLFIRVSNLRRHKCVPTEFGGEAVSCDICNRKFSHKRFLQRHMTMHNPPKYECETCHGKFTRIDFYNNHMCVTETGERVQIQRNIKKDDLFGLTHAICPTCGKSYSSVSNLNKHMKTHGEKTETCDACGKRFHLKIALREHMQSVHTKEYKYTCQYCGKSMKCRNSLFGHVRQFHSQTIIMYQCEQCGKQFRQKGNLKKHVLTHSAKRTFECKDCDRKFKFPDQLKRHETWHTHGERFVCEFCCKKFVMQFELRKHLQRYHSGLMYVCRHCNTECRHSHTMKRHLQHRHPDQLDWQENTSEYIKQLIPQARINAAEEKGLEEDEVNKEDLVLPEETSMVKDDEEVVEETAETALLDNAMLAAQLQAQIQDPTLPLENQPFIVAEVSGLASGDPDATQTVIIQTTAGQQFDNELMSQEVAAALQSLTKQGVGDNTFTIIQNMPLGEQTDLQVAENMGSADQPFIILPMVTEAGNVTDPAAGFEATAQITTVPDGV